MSDEMRRLLNLFESVEVTEREDPCWDGYEMVGMKTKDGKKVPNCVPENFEGNELTLGDDIVEVFGYYDPLAENLSEAEYQGRDVKLGKIMRGDVKKYKVYVKNKKGNVVKVNFGSKEMSIKRNDPERRKSFKARHKCKQKHPRTSARYWSCRAWNPSTKLP